MHRSILRNLRSSLIVVHFFSPPPIRYFPRARECRADNTQRRKKRRDGGPMALRHSHSPTIVSRVFISSRCIFVQHHAPSLSLSRSLLCQVTVTCARSHVSDTLLHISLPDHSRLVFSRFYFPPSPLLRRNGSNYSREECRDRVG